MPRDVGVPAIFGQRIVARENGQFTLMHFDHARIFLDAKRTIACRHLRQAADNFKPYRAAMA